VVSSGYAKAFRCPTLGPANLPSDSLLTHKNLSGVSKIYALAKTFLLLFVSAVVIFPCHANAGDIEDVHSEAATHSAIFTKGRKSLQLVSGVLFSPTVFGPRTRVFNYAQTNLRIGWMLNSPRTSKSLLRGNVEAIFEITNSIIFKGSGDYMGGITGLIRYNFVQPHTKFFPYVQGGIGVIYNDAYKDHSQNAIGQAIEFTPQFSSGFRYLINENCSIDAEAMFHHISNAGLADRNSGINAFGGFIGLTHFYD
jgi:lipid A 3-O-deacylase